MFFEKMQATASFTYIPYLEKTVFSLGEWITRVAHSPDRKSGPHLQMETSGNSSKPVRPLAAGQTLPKRTGRQLAFSCLSTRLPVVYLSPGETHISTLKLLLKRVFHSMGYKCASLLACHHHWRFDVQLVHASAIISRQGATQLIPQQHNPTINQVWPYL